MDWNGDGHRDILSGCYWTEGADAGHIQWLAGSGSLDVIAGSTAHEQTTAGGQEIVPSPSTRVWAD